MREQEEGCILFSTGLGTSGPLFGYLPRCGTLCSWLEGRVERMDSRGQCQSATSCGVTGC